MRTLLIIVLIAVGFPAQAQQPAACSGAVHRQFDFWLGDWDVFDPKGNLAGKNAITKEERGCLLVERWTGAGGSTGQSYNFVDPAIGKWRQVWVSAGAVIDYTGGLNAAGEMVLEGTISYPGGGAPTAPFKGKWTNNPDGTVVQHFELFDSDKGVWADWFVGTYKRRG